PKLSESTRIAFDFFSETHEADRFREKKGPTGLFGFLGNLYTGLSLSTLLTSAIHGELDNPAVLLANGIAASMWAIPQLRKHLVQWVRNRASSDVRKQYEIDIKNSLYFRGKDLYDFLEQAFDMVRDPESSSNDIAYFSRVTQISRNFYLYLKSLNGQDDFIYVTDVRQEEENQVRSEDRRLRQAELSFQMYLDFAPEDGEPGLLIVSRVSSASLSPPSRRRQSEGETSREGSWIPESGGVLQPGYAPIPIPTDQR
ncbi:MAG: hypothetical protein AAF202_11735, partial [Pseudomonadota bacterium]